MFCSNQNKKLNSYLLFQTLGLCSSDKNLVLKPSKPDTVPMVKLDDALYFKPHGHMLGQDECTYGPAFWCKDEQTARRCNVSQDLGFLFQFNNSCLSMALSKLIVPGIFN